MNKKVHYIGLDVHKESIAVSIAPEGTAGAGGGGVASAQAGGRFTS